MPQKQTNKQLRLTTRGVIERWNLGGTGKMQFVSGLVSDGLNLTCGGFLLGITLITGEKVALDLSRCPAPRNQIRASRLAAQIAKSVEPDVDRDGNLIFPAYILKLRQLE